MCVYITQRQTHPHPTCYPFLLKVKNAALPNYTDFTTPCGTVNLQLETHWHKQFSAHLLTTTPLSLPLFILVPLPRVTPPSKNMSHYKPWWGWRARCWGWNLRFWGIFHHALPTLSLLSQVTISQRTTHSEINSFSVAVD